MGKVWVLEQVRQVAGRQIPGGGRRQEMPESLSVLER